MFSRALIKKMNHEERNLVKEGAIAMLFLTGGISYFNYRQYLRKEFYRSEGHYRFSSYVQNCTPW